MSERNVVRLYRYESADAFRIAASRAASYFDAAIHWNRAAQSATRPLRHESMAGVQTLEMSYFQNNSPLSLRLGRLLQCAWIEVRIQEGAYWDYSLYQGDTHLHSFSADPAYFDQDAGECLGDARVLAHVWDKPVSAIDRYLVQWPREDVGDGIYRYAISGKAYPTDEFEYGDIWQWADFIRTLGGTPWSLQQWPHSIQLSHQ